MAVVIHRQILDLKMFPVGTDKLLQVFQRFQYGRMLKTGGNDMLSFPSVCHGRSDQGHIIGFGTSGSENDLLILHFQDLSKDPGGILQILFGGHAFYVFGRRISKIGPHDLFHKLYDFVVDPCCRRIIKIYVQI